jgi:hypothetical protein
MYLNRALRQTSFILVLLIIVLSMPAYSAGESEPAKIPTKIVWNNPTTESLKPNLLGGNYAMSVTLADISNNPLVNRTISWSSEAVGISQATITDTDGLSVNPVMVYHQDRNRSYDADITIQFAGDDIYEPVNVIFTLKCYDIGPPVIYSVIGQVLASNDNPERNISNSSFKVSVVRTSYYSETNDAGDFNFKIDLGKESISYSTSKLRISKPGYLSREVMIQEFLTVSTQNIKDPIKMLAGDINQDDAINMTDLVEMAKAFNAIEGDDRYNSVCDLDSDRVINVADVIIIATNFNKTPLDYESLDRYFIK